MKFELEENIQSYDVADGNNDIGRLHNQTGGRGFMFMPDKFATELTAEQLRQIATKLDELNAL